MIHSVLIVLVVSTEMGGFTFVNIETQLPMLRPHKQCIKILLKYITVCIFIVNFSVITLLLSNLESSVVLVQEL